MRFNQHSAFNQPGVKYHRYTVGILVTTYSGMPSSRTFWCPLYFDYLFRVNTVSKRRHKLWEELIGSIDGTSIDRQGVPGGNDPQVYNHASLWLVSPTSPSFVQFHQDEDDPTIIFSATSRGYC
jgi:hypothetical protein